jgi:hypothetical protein
MTPCNHTLSDRTNVRDNVAHILRFDTTEPASLGLFPLWFDDAILQEHTLVLPVPNYFTKRERLAMYKRIQNIVEIGKLAAIVTNKQDNPLKVSDETLAANSYVIELSGKCPRHKHENHTTAFCVDVYSFLGAIFFSPMAAADDDKPFSSVDTTVYYGSTSSTLKDIGFHFYIDSIRLTAEKRLNQFITAIFYIYAGEYSVAKQKLADDAGVYNPKNKGLKHYIDKVKNLAGGGFAPYKDAYVFTDVLQKAITVANNFLNDND